ncbi:hypothetical protein ABTX82_16820 [Streptomyces lavendulae]|uniref:hypothetical protein n=1 Tax=Streptomyces lavendulae TaxID=1914 RepID=UPI0033302D20
MGDTLILWILGIAGVIAILLFSVKGLLDQVPDVIDSAGRARDAWDRFKKPQNPAPPPQDREPPAAA